MNFNVEKKGIVFKFTINELDMKIRFACSACEPSQAEDGLYVGRYEKGCIYFTGVKIGGKKVDGIRIDDDAIVAQLDALKSTLLRKSNVVAATIAAYIPQKIQWAMGGDTHQIHISTTEVDTRITKPDILKYAKKIIQQKPQYYRALSKSLGERGGFYSLGGWWEMELSAIASEVEAEKQKEAEALALAEKQKAEMEGAVAFNRCPECGAAKIVGQMINGHVRRMDKTNWAKAQKAFKLAWSKQFDIADKELLSSTGTGWQKYFEQLGFKSIIISENYDDC